MWSSVTLLHTNGHISLKLRDYILIVYYNHLFFIYFYFLLILHHLQTIFRSAKDSISSFENTWCSYNKLTRSVRDNVSSFSAGISGSIIANFSSSNLQVSPRRLGPIAQKSLNVIPLSFISDNLLFLNEFHLILWCPSIPNLYAMCSCISSQVLGVGRKMNWAMNIILQLEKEAFILRKDAQNEKLDSCFRMGDSHQSMA